MKKRKTYEVSVIDKTYSRIISDETKFYTSDTALELGFELKETEYIFESAEIVLFNTDDRSLVTRPVAKNLDGFAYELEDDIIAHYGEWRGQVRFEQAGEIYVSSPVKFRIENDLSNERPPQLSDVQSWVSLKRYAESLVDELKQAVLSVEGIEDTFNANESERQSQFASAEQSRQTTFETNESERDETFNTNEDIRKAQELEREGAEATRQIIFDGNEAIRTETFNTNEATRQENESTRQQAESQRQSTFEVNESERQTTFENAEHERQSAELIRVENEKQRIENDDNRENDINYLANGLTELQIHVGYVEKGVLGLEADFENNKFTRIGDAEGRTPGASFDGFNMYGGRRRVNLADDGTVNAVFGEGGYTEDGSNGQVMVEQPVFYYKVVPLKTQPVADGHGQNLMKARYYVSDQPRAGFKVHPAFKDHNGKTRQKVYVSAYESTIFDTSEGVYLKLDEQVADFASDKLSSIANAKPASGVTQSLTRENARKLANNRGQGWHQQTLATASMSQLLFIIEYASFNSQSALGAGFISDPDDDTTSARAKNTGATQTLGNKSGSVDVDGYAIPTYRGEENLWGNIFSIVDGFTLEGKGKHNGWYALGDYRENGIDGSYKPFGFTIAKANGYIKYFGYSEDADFAFIPGATNGGANSALPVGDYLYQKNAYDGFLVARLGGSWGHGANAGLFHWILYHASSTRSRDLGARLVYAP